MLDAQRQLPVCDCEDEIVTPVGPRTTICGAGTDEPRLGSGCAFGFLCFLEGRFVLLFLKRMPILFRIFPLGGWQFAPNV